MLSLNFKRSQADLKQWGVVGRERVGTAFPQIFHVLFQNEFEAV